MDVARILREYGVRPSKGLGQNFLVSEGVLDRIVASADLGPDDLVLEVGPGLGLMTRRLAEAACAVVAVELDRRMVAILSERLADLPNVHVVQADILEIDPAEAVAEATGSAVEGLAFKVVANLPYYITSAALRHLLEGSRRPALLTVMVQREVAQRIVAEPGGMSLLSLAVQVYGRPTVVARVPAGAFYPPPKVDSAVVRIDVYEEPVAPEETIARLFWVARAGFAQKRKQLANSLSANLRLPRDVVVEALASAGLDPSARPQTLAVADWLRLAESLPG